MALHVALTHRTLYDYDRSVRMGPQVVRLRPAPHSRTPILSYSLGIEPEGYFLNWQQDPFGNYLARIVFPEKVKRFHINIDLVADMVVHNPFDFFLEPKAETFPFTYEENLRKDLEPFLEVEPATGKLAQWLAEVSREEMQSVDFLVALNQRLQNDIGYVIRMEPGVQTPEETLSLGKGSCRDSGWLLVQILRHLGLASRFVSGYLLQLVPDVKSLDGPSGPEQDFTDLHAWTEVFLPGAGWVGLDPTSGLFAGEGHIPLACTPHPTTAAPVTGIVDDCETHFRHEMQITRIKESPRVTKPYTEEQWQAITKLGHEIDDRLKAQDVRLTIGGEPTFISIDHPDGAEWNTAATGPTKRALASKLIKRLRDRFAPGGLLHFGQGKWYPGEQLPRWAFSLYWRRDGKPLWTGDEDSGENKDETKPTVADAQALLKGIGERLEVGTETIAPLYEDPWHFVSGERKLPENLTAQTNKLDDPMARDRLARVIERGLDDPVGYLLPVQPWNAPDGTRMWRTENWSTRSGKLFLLPGDSPCGLRLPMPSLPYVAPLEYPYIVASDPLAEPDESLPEPNPKRQRFRQQKQDSAPAEGGEDAQQVNPQRAGSPGKHARSALTIEPRDGTLKVFMPPVEELGQYLDLVTAIEDAATELTVPIELEGYEPPKDSRINVIKVTPDPGVIEVNVHPTAGWDELCELTESLYEEARATRLTTEKFMLDGRHTGTGGGNHVVLGARRPADSPFLRRPDLLRSLVTYWQNHPSLSYLFSGLFIGPTSQAPRIDEARHDSLFELELAFSQIDRDDQTAAPAVPPWLVDRLFRNLLVDVTGNTHRAEICIDKLYSPDGPTGRLGLVEFRAFEMPPHARMSLAQQLLLLSLVARFWETPCKNRLVRWGTTLHDKFMLPHFVQEDFSSVIDDMNAAGFALELDWFAPHLSFRFPLCGRIEFGSIAIEVRQALEPWHVLGEEGAVGGTVRYVDSSVERVEVRASGLTEGRYAIACNGKAVPLIPTGEQGSFVGGVRYRAWQPSASLHPTIPVDAPLVFDLYDRWTGRAVAGCTYHVAHPGGRNFETFPVNSYEAESRRLARFFPFGHSIGACPEPENLQRPEFPCTLDLRWSHPHGSH